MGRRPKATSGELALPPRIVATADLYTSFSDAVATCFNEPRQSAVVADPLIVQRAYGSLRPKLRLKFWGSALSVAAMVLALGIGGAATLGEVSLSPVGFSVVLALFFMPFFVHFGWHYWQHSGSIVPVTHETDPTAEAIFAELKAPGGARLLVRSFLTGQYVPLDRKLYSSRLRYLLLSGDRKLRSYVTAYPTAVSLSGELYLTPTDADRLKQALPPKRRGGPGRKPKYDYTAATVSVLDEYSRKRLPNDPAGARREIEDRLMAWFKKLNDPSCTIPRRDQVKPHAIRIYDVLTSQR